MPASMEHYWWTAWHWEQGFDLVLPMVVPRVWQTWKETGMEQVLEICPYLQNQTGCTSPGSAPMKRGIAIGYKAA